MTFDIILYFFIDSTNKLSLIFTMEMCTLKTKNKTIDKIICTYLACISNFLRYDTLTLF